MMLISSIWVSVEYFWSYYLASFFLKICADKAEYERSKVRQKLNSIRSDMTQYRLQKLFPKGCTVFHVKADAATSFQESGRVVGWSDQGEDAMVMVRFSSRPDDDFLVPVGFLSRDVPPSCVADNFMIGETIYMTASNHEDMHFGEAGIITGHSWQMGHVEIGN